MSNRHRRTRIYGANYDIGESYYKKQLNELDNKAAGYNRTVGIDSLNDNKIIPKVSFLGSDTDFNDFSSRPSLRNRNIDSFENGDYKSSLKTDYSKYLEDFENDFSKDVKSSSKQISTDISRFRADSPEIPQRSFLKYSLKKEDSPLDFEKKAVSSVSIRSKYVSVNEKDEDNFAASHRASATKARLEDLEAEMSSLASKQNEREKRKQNLKKILASSSNNEVFE